MSPTLKRIALILGLLIFAGLIGFTMFLMFRKGQINETTPGQEQTQPGGKKPIVLPGSGIRSTTAGGSEVTENELPIANIVSVTTNTNYYRPEPIKKITDDNTQFTSLTDNGTVRYHNAGDGKFYTIVNGKLVALTDQVFYNVKNVTWAKNSNKAVIEYPDDSKIVYNFDTEKQTTLPKHWQDFSFSPDSSEIAAKSIGLSPDNRWLVTTKDDGTGIQLIEPLGDNADKVIMDWSPSKQTVAFSRTGEAQGTDRQEVLMIGLNGENFKSLVVEGLDFLPKWSPTGQKLIYSVDSARSDFKPELWVVNGYGDGIGTGRKLLDVNTWANKCTFVDDGSIVCAVPRYLPEGAGMAPAIAADTPDDMYKIDLRTGLKVPIALDKDYTINSISFDSSGNKIIFSDSHQNGAFELSL
jgi:hypothetical protein